MSFSHILVLAVIAILVIPPEKLPEVMRNLARFLNDLKRNTSGIWDDIKKDAALKPEDILKYKESIKPPPVTPTAATEETQDDKTPKS